MNVLAPAPVKPAPFGRLVEHPRGVPEHGQFVLGRLAVSGAAQPRVLSTKAGTQLWRSPDDNLDRVLSEAKAVAAHVGQAVAIIQAEPGHWQQLFVVPLFQQGASGALDAIHGVAELQDAALTRAHHLVGVADSTTAIDLRSRPIDPTLLPPRARPSDIPSLPPTA